MNEKVGVQDVDVKRKGIIATAPWIASHTLPQLWFRLVLEQKDVMATTNITRASTFTLRSKQQDLQSIFRQINPRDKHPASTQLHSAVAPLCLVQSSPVQRAGQRE